MRPEIDALLNKARAMIQEDSAAAIPVLASLIDASGDAKNKDGVQEALSLALELAKKELSPVQEATLHYYRGNAYALLKRLSGTHTDSWEDSSQELELYHLRSALPDTLFRTLPREVQCSLLTNLANALHGVGRHSEAIEYWDRALASDPTFAMAHGNRGCARSAFSRVIPDLGHALVFLRHAEADLVLALASKHIHPSARSVFDDNLVWVRAVRKHNDTGIPIDLDRHDLGRSKSERAYREWCLKNRLFLNPLNDLGPHPIAARDVMDAPSIIVSLGDGPSYPGLFNQMKQEYVSARFFYYQGRFRDRAHYSDRDVRMYNTLDYPAYGIGVEEVKASFRGAYSLLDKVAFFLNDYFQLDIKPSDVTFRTLWYADRKRENGLRPEFSTRNNRPLRGMFWLAKDLFEDRDGFRDATEPDAQKLQLIRNVLEHRYLKLHLDLWSGPPAGDERAHIEDRLAHSIYLEDFDMKALRLLKLARVALINLACAVAVEERDRRSKHEGKIGSMFLDTWEDNWKRRI